MSFLLTLCKLTCRNTSLYKLSCERQLLLSDKVAPALLKVFHWACLLVRLPERLVHKSCSTFTICIGFYNYSAEYELIICSEANWMRIFGTTLVVLTFLCLYVISPLVFIHEFYSTFLELFDMKTKYDESDNLIIRATRTFTDKVSEMFGTFPLSIFSIWIVVSLICFLNSSFVQGQLVSDTFKKYWPYSWSG